MVFVQRTIFYLIDRTAGRPDTLVLMSIPPETQNEWQRGWRIVLGAALGVGTGASLFFYSFSLFVLPMSEEFGVTRGAMAGVQALVIVGAISSPLIGWATDQWGFRKIFTASIMAMIAVHLFTALLVTSLPTFAISALCIGFVGTGTTGLTTTRPVNAWFDANRGLALGLSAMGLSLMAVITPPLLAELIAAAGWRAGYFALAALAAAVGLPAVLLLVKNEPGDGDQARIVRERPPGDFSFLRGSAFWQLATALVAMSIAGGGFISQMSPVIQEEGISAPHAAFAVSAYAVGQIFGRILTGVALDNFPPRRVAFLFIFVPASGFLLLWSANHSFVLALIAAALIGIQHGAEIDIFAYFVARRFGMDRYGSVYGAILGMGWIGNALGIVGFGRLHDFAGSYDLPEFIGALSLAIGALLIASVKLPTRQAEV